MVYCSNGLKQYLLVKKKVKGFSLLCYFNKLSTLLLWLFFCAEVAAHFSGRKIFYLLYTIY
jgi:hypothetical protein